MTVIQAMMVENVIRSYIGWNPGTKPHSICDQCHEPIMRVAAILRTGETRTVEICACRLSPEQQDDRRMRQHNRTGLHE